MKKLLTIVLLTAAVIGVTYLVRPQLLRAPSNEQELVCSGNEVKNDYVKYCGQDGKTALELLLFTAPTDFQKYDFGAFVKSINDVKPDEKHFWKLYVNGAESQVGADQVQTKNGDLIEWRLAEITE